MLSYTDLEFLRLMYFAAAQAREFEAAETAHASRRLQRLKRLGLCNVFNEGYYGCWWCVAPAAEWIVEQTDQVDDKHFEYPLDTIREIARQAGKTVAELNENDIRRRGLQRWASNSPNRNYPSTPPVLN